MVIGTTEQNRRVAACKRIGRRTNSVVDKMPKAKPAAQPAYIRKAAALRAAAQFRLLAKPEIMALTGVSFPTIWEWIRAGKFPRGRIVGGQTRWRSDEVDAWLAGLSVRPLKDDNPQHDSAA
jgi:prophage regulatory protein